MKCYEGNFIGVRGYCGSIEPESGLYINDLPGISIARAADTTDESYTRGVDFLYAQEKIAFDLTIQDFKQQLMTTFDIVSVVDVYEKRHKSKEMTFRPLGVGQKGFTVEKCVNDPFVNIRLDFVELFAETAFSGFLVTVTDGSDSFTKSFDLKVGFNRLYMGYTAFSDFIEVEYDSADVKLHNSSQCVYQTCSTLIINEDENQGLAFRVSLVCDLDMLGCFFKQELKYAMLYRQGVLIAENYKSSDRIAPSLWAAKMDTENLLLKWWGGRDPKTGFEVRGEYWRHLKSAMEQIKKILKNSHSLCIDCTNFKYHQILP